MELKLGKLPPAILERHLLGMTGAKSGDLLVPPSVGLDFGVVRHGGRHMIVSSDPITGVKERIGWYAVNVSANDVATSGNRPQFMQSVILMPERATVRDVARISSEMHKTALALGITIVGGHTELTPGLKRPIVVTTAFAFADTYVTAAGARHGDSIMMTKTAGIEGTAICAADAPGLERLDARTLKRAKGYFRKMSIVSEAEAAFGTGGVHAMHDCTEGGVLGAAFEMSSAAGLGFDLDGSVIPVSAETAAICTALKIDPLRLISSGTLLIAVKPGKEPAVAAAVKGIGSSATIVGRFTKGRRVLVRGDGTAEGVEDAPTDEIWRLVRARKP